MQSDYKSVEAHSCGLCRTFNLSLQTHTRVEDVATVPLRPSLLNKINQREESQHARYSYISKPYSLTKEALLRGYSRQCPLFQWISNSLSRSLNTFSTEVARKGILVQPRLQNACVSGLLQDDGMDDPKHKLDLIDPSRGLDIRIIVNYNVAEGGRLAIGYDPNPIVLDKLWMATPNLQNEMTYAVFQRMYKGEWRTPLMGYTTSDDPTADWIFPRPAKLSLDAEDSFPLARRWLDECTHLHHNCARHPGVLPARVIDVGTRFPVRTAKLYWTEEGEFGRYLALSYCWGGGQSLVTTTATAQEFTDGISTSKIPKTILEAINLTHELGLRFLWVDALCIIQDDPEDVAREISKMAQIYQGAWITVSAACAKSVHDSFLSQQRMPTGPSVKLPVALSDSVKGWLYLQQPHVYSSTEDPIHLRAWTLQEHILPPRILLFGTQGLWWTCSSKEYSDISNTIDRSNVHPPQIIPGSTATTHPTLSSWRSIVRGYTRRFLTISTDKLPAIAGVAAHYSKTFNGAYLAGLWEFALVSELLWCSSRSDITRPVVKRAPSWSWAAIDGEVHHDWCPLSLGPRCPQIRFCTITPTSRSSPFGSVDPQQCVLGLEAHLAEVYWHEGRRRIFQIHPENMYDPESMYEFEIGRSQADALEVSKHAVGMKVWALLVQEEPCRGLLLVPVDGNTFRRVGMFYRIWKPAACQFERRVIEII